MAKFNYIIRTIDGASRSGQIEATSRDAAANILTKDREGIFITSLIEEGEKKFTTSSLFKARIKLQDKLFFVQQLSIMIKSGLSITGALKSLRDQAENKRLQGILHEVLTDVKGGQSLSSALSKHPDLLPDVYVKIIASGEKSGKLDRVLLKLAKDIEKSYDLRSKIRGAMLYPAFLLVVMVIVVIIVLVTVIPQLKGMFADVGVALPITTRMLIFMSDAFTKYWWATGIVIILLTLGLWQYGKTENGRFVFDTIKIKLPIFGKLNQKIYMARFCRTLNTLISAGMPILEVFDTLEEVIGNVIYQKEVRQARQKIESGFPISSALRENPHFPPVVNDLIAVGEKSGNLAYVLRNLTRFFERDVDYMTKNLATMLEPVLLVIMAVGVAFIVASVIMPIYGLVQVIQ